MKNHTSKIAENNYKPKIGKYEKEVNFSNIDWSNAQKIFTADRLLYEKKIYRGKRLKLKVKEILPVLAGGAVLGLSFVFPALPMAVAPFILDSQKFEKGLFNQNLNRMKRQKLVEVVDENGMTVVKITDKGKVRALRYKLDEMSIKIPQKWDRKWRIVTFDIPEKDKYAREIFRAYLKKLGFYQLQKSVWVYPYDCFYEIEFLRNLFEIDVNITFIVAEKIENDELLKENFPL